MGARWSEWSSSLEPVEAIQLPRYARRWYQIAALPTWFQQPDARDVTATYALLADGTLHVRNEETRADGTHVVVNGVAELDPACRDEGACGRLLVAFEPSREFPLIPPVPARYWVIQLAADYRYAVVSEPKRRYLWILSSTPTLSAQDYTAIIARLSGTQGFSEETLSRLVRTQHTTTVAAAAKKVGGERGYRL